MSASATRSLPSVCSSKLAELERAFPLPPAWSKPELFSEPAPFGGGAVWCVGLTAESAAGKGAVGSAVGAPDEALTRAWFELLERAVLLDFLATAPSGAAWPQSPNPGEWQYAKSNGVAAHKTRAAACASAALELLERDRILRAWRGELPVRPLGLSLDQIPAELHAVYDFRLVAFGSGASEVTRLAEERVFVCGVFALPKTNDGHALQIFGFGAGNTVLAATQKATGECLQRLAFLTGEGVDPKPVFAPTADYHQEVYLNPARLPVLLAWLRQTSLPSTAEVTKLPGPADVKFVELTPSYLQGRVVVVKAFCETALPLVFGRWPAAVLGQVPADRDIHPVG